MQTEAQQHGDTLTAADYTDTIKLKFPGRGSILTPAHAMRDFKFKDYAPSVYKKIREVRNSDNTATTRILFVYRAASHAPSTRSVWNALTGCNKEERSTATARKCISISVEPQEEDEREQC